MCRRMAVVPHDKIVAFEPPTHSLLIGGQGGDELSNFVEGEVLAVLNMGWITDLEKGALQNVEVALRQGQHDFMHCIAGHWGVAPLP